VTGRVDGKTYGQWWDSPGERQRVQIADVYRLGLAGLERSGAGQADARFLVDMFLDKALQGDHTRGIGLLVATVERALAGDLDVCPEVDVRRQRAAAALVTAGPKACGDLVCKRGMDAAIDSARSLGIGIAAVQAQCRLHVPYLRQAVSAGLVGIATAQSFPTVAPLGGYEPLLGNAPVGIGIPTAGRPPFLLDMSLTQSSNKGVVVAAQQGLPVPAGVLLDSRGNPTVDSGAYLDAGLTELTGVATPRGSLVPLGGGHKGFGLILALSVLTSLLADGSPSWGLRPGRGEPGTPSAVFIAIDAASLRPGESLPGPAMVDEFLEAVTSAPVRNGAGEIIYPGLYSQELQAARREAGWFTAPAQDIKALAGLARRLDLAATADNGQHGEAEELHAAGAQVTRPTAQGRGGRPRRDRRRCRGQPGPAGPGPGCV
jgi:L-2-hydroxycarboxylate dehydrogenase (NAD+)